MIIDILPPDTPMGTVKLAHAFPRLLCCEEIGQAGPQVSMSLSQVSDVLLGSLSSLLFSSTHAMCPKSELFNTCYLIECLLLLIEFVYSRSCANSC